MSPRMRIVSVILVRSSWRLGASPSPSVPSKTSGRSPAMLVCIAASCNSASASSSSACLASSNFRERPSMLAAVNFSSASERSSSSENIVCRGWSSSSESTTESESFSSSSLPNPKSSSAWLSMDPSLIPSISSNSSSSMPSASKSDISSSSSSDSNCACFCTGFFFSLPAVTAAAFFASLPFATTTLALFFLLFCTSFTASSSSTSVRLRFCPDSAFGSDAPPDLRFL
ncbi:hypothetical protein BJY00DRAFT_288204 [Aspergillus carlsbadensis]|nr:hypothetical protein BJY00DRAFT_288204 [Aspergillus carlsbadensis]